MKQNKPIAHFFSALAFLTTIPVKQRTEWEDRGKLAFFPLVGLLIGVLLVIVDALAGIFFSMTARGLIDILFLIVITGGLHLDGLADSADGLFSHKEKKWRKWDMLEQGKNMVSVIKLSGNGFNFMRMG